MSKPGDIFERSDTGSAYTLWQRLDVFWRTVSGNLMSSDGKADYQLADSPFRALLNSSEEDRLAFQEKIRVVDVHRYFPKRLLIPPSGFKAPRTPAEHMVLARGMSFTFSAEDDCVPEITFVPAFVVPTPPVMPSPSASASLWGSGPQRQTTKRRRLK
jgi:hypothetical protein